MRREWAGRLGLKKQEIQIEDTALVEGGGSISPRNWAGNVCNIFGGWLDLYCRPMG